jgi:hypothetical protein
VILNMVEELDLNKDGEVCYSELNFRRTDSKTKQVIQNFRVWRARPALPVGCSPSCWGVGAGGVPASW